MIHVTDATFKQVVLDDPGLVLVDFWAPWCMPCRILGPIIDKLAREYDGKIKIVKLNTDENPVTAAKYDIMAIPTLIIFKAGQPIHNIAGLLPEAQLKQILDQLLAA
ncbi:MAG: thioredoxin [Firmicutes bacterium]|nr:thioredoxin [Bacillota bacterium]